MIHDQKETGKNVTQKYEDPYFQLLHLVAPTWNIEEKTIDQ